MKRIYYTQEQINTEIGGLDRALSSLKLIAMSNIDPANLQTVKHHAEDCIGLGNRVLQILAKRQ